MNLNGPFYLVQINNQPRYRDPVAGAECDASAECVCERANVCFIERGSRERASWQMVCRIGM